MNNDTRKRKNTHERLAWELVECVCVCMYMYEAIYDLRFLLRKDYKEIASLGLARKNEAVAQQRFLLIALIEDVEIPALVLILRLVKIK